MIELPKMRSPRTTPERVYIRFGRWSTRSRNHATGEQEAGVSVYRATLVDGVVKVDDDVSEQLVGQGRLVFAVTGREVVGLGSDGEPRLRGVRFLPYAIDCSLRVWS